MKIIVPMAGRGSRLRPHTLTIPKPLIPVAGKPIVHRLVEDIAGVLNQDIEEVAFIIHESFGEKVEQDLIAIAEKLVVIVKNKLEEGLARKQELNEAEVNLINLQDKLSQLDYNTSIQHQNLALFFENKVILEFLDIVSNNKSS